MRELDALIADVHREALRAPFPIDEEVYRRAGRDPQAPILCAGSLDARVCVFARDLGKDEVTHGQPLIGAGGRLVRAGLLRAVHGREPDPKDTTLFSALDHVLLTNTVPYKPPGNKAYSTAVKDRFRPFLVELLTVHWRGDTVLTLGNEAFDWFVRHAAAGAAQALWDREDRYQGRLPCSLRSPDGSVVKEIAVLPLPHPSPLNARWYSRFPGLLDDRLKGLVAPRA